ncbi:hypothetical protein BSL78_20691 [Apostichopus japonicus]|uniref:Uncharacterized protein n=1 Tax=Stichopus japonicus TaxID=307972 RepID=A0A2G8K381_STIJA|nr:hypothetical protein BSL78_20691 [Apostichopus japonicus]
MFTSFRLTERITIEPSVYVAFRELMKESSPKSKKQLATALQKLFPFAKKGRKQIGGISVLVYHSISMIQKENVIPNEEPTLQLQELTKYIQADVILVSCSPEKLEVSVSASMFVDGNMVMKDIQICDGTWTLKVRGRSIDIDKLDLDSRFVCTERGFLKTIDIVRKLSRCRGFHLIEPREELRYFRVEKIRSEISSTDVTVIRSSYCKQVLSWAATSGICTCCKKLPSLNLGKDVILDEDDDSDISRFWRAISQMHHLR